MSSRNSHNNNSPSLNDQNNREADSDQSEYNIHNASQNMQSLEIYSQFAEPVRSFESDSYLRGQIGQTDYSNTHLLGWQGTQFGSINQPSSTEQFVSNLRRYDNVLESNTVNVGSTITNQSLNFQYDSFGHPNSRQNTNDINSTFTSTSNAISNPYLNDLQTMTSNMSMNQNQDLNYFYTSQPELGSYNTVRNLWASQTRSNNNELSDRNVAAQDSHRSNLLATREGTSQNNTLLEHDVNNMQVVNNNVNSLFNDVNFNFDDAIYSPLGISQPISNAHFRVEELQDFYSSLHSELAQQPPIAATIDSNRLEPSDFLFDFHSSSELRSIPSNVDLHNLPFSLTPQGSQQTQQINRTLQRQQTDASSQSFSAQGMDENQDRKLSTVKSSAKKSTVDGHKSTTSSAEAFPSKLYRLVTDCERDGLDHVVAFAASGFGFYIHDRNAFMHEVAPRYFNLNKFTSFKRQMYLYGFELVQEGQNKGSYYHKHFCRGDDTMLHKIQRDTKGYVEQAMKKKSTK